MASQRSECDVPHLFVAVDLHPVDAFALRSEGILICPTSGTKLRESRSSAFRLFSSLDLAASLLPCHNIAPPTFGMPLSMFGYGEEHQVDDSEWQLDLT